ncbi:MAG: NUDIX hydrolase [Magnetococcales bacterium]|nr:NUDIX hydrolase [Magnetococcales bacterium]
MSIKKAIDQLEALVTDPSKGLGEDVFYMVSRLTPLVNVDLLIRDVAGRILLTWRSDIYHGDGWHIPGGILRYKEVFSDRVIAVAASELQTTVSFSEEPQSIQQNFNNIATRGHFVSLLFACKLTGNLPQNMQFMGGTPKVGEWCWFKEVPDDMLEIHKKMYKSLFSPGL